MQINERASLLEALALLREHREVLILLLSRVMVLKYLRGSYHLREVRGSDMIRLPATEGVGAAFPSLPPPT